MLRKTADYAVRVALLLSMTAYGVAPAAAAILPQPDIPSATRSSTLSQLEELQPILAALADKPSRQTVDHPTPGRDRTDSRTDSRDHDRLEILLSSYKTREIVLDFNSIRRECGQYDEIYRIDCLRQGIDMVAASLPDNSEYREAKRILKKASSRLGRLVSSYQDPAAPKLVALPDANPRFRKRRQYTAIKREAVPQAMEQANKIVEEATTQLLRSGENSERRYVHYQDISVAVDSTKTLLRSG